VKNRYRRRKGLTANARRKARPKPRYNPALRTDPTRSLTLRRQFAAKVKNMFAKLRLAIHAAIVDGDALGLKERKLTRNAFCPTGEGGGIDFVSNDMVWDRPTGNMTANADEWRFRSDPEKVKAFQAWLRKQMAQYLVGKAQDDLWRTYVEQGFRKGAARSFDDATATEKFIKATGETVGFHEFYEGSKTDFLRSAFRQPETVDKVKLLAGRTFDDLKNVTQDMSTRMSRVLTDGLVQGHNPRQIARALDSELDVGRTRALTIARTEIIRAHAEGQLSALEQLGVEEVGAAVEWSTAGDERVCHLCAPLEGVVLKLAEAKGMLPRHPNCRCAWIPANVGEDQSKSKTTKREISRAVRTSEERGGEDEKERWAWGPGKEISKTRPESIVNVDSRLLSEFEERIKKTTQER
jgi:SPP1 gp7 family putative phage head morphogenesis protein